MSNEERIRRAQDLVDTIALEVSEDRIAALESLLQNVGTQSFERGNNIVRLNQHIAELEAEVELLKSQLKGTNYVNPK